MSTDGALASPAAARTGEPWRVPFNVVDELVHLLDNDTAPWSIQLEARVGGSLDEARLRAAFQQALERHPMARARKVPSRRTQHRDTWEIPPVADLDALRVIDCPDEVALDAARARLQSTPVPLVESPPLRALLARNPGGDVFMLNLNHAATDGFGALRILHSVARVYRDAPDPRPEPDFMAQRDLTTRLAAKGTGTRIRRYLAVADRLRDLLSPPARVARAQAADAPGYGLHHVRLGREETERLVGLGHAGSVNDVLLAALHLAIADWNRERRSSCRRVTVLVPANLRPAQWRQETVGNFSLPARIATSRRDRGSPAAALRAVTAQTARKKRTGLGTGLLQILERSHVVPLWAKEVLVGLAPVGGNRFVDSAILSNLGRVEVPSFGAEAGETVEVWFSAPARMPLGLSVGAVTAAGCLHLAFRYRRRLFGPDAAGRFADAYLGRLRQLLHADPR